MAAGETRRFWIPGKLGFGERADESRGLPPGHGAVVGTLWLERDGQDVMLILGCALEKSSLSLSPMEFYTDLQGLLFWPCAEAFLSSTCVC